MGGTSSTNMSKKFVDDAITSNKVVVFSKSYCGFCKRAKNALKETGLEDFVTIELDGRDDCDSIQNHLMTLTGIRSVPQVFVDTKFIGDSTKILALQASGELKTILVDCGAL